MALATQCPFCQTTFRVAGDQLKLRDGLVRCGHCNEVFNGNAHLLSEHQGAGNWPSAVTASSPPIITPAIARANAAVPNYGVPPAPALPDADAMEGIEAAWDLELPAASAPSSNVYPNAYSDTDATAADARHTDDMAGEPHGLNDDAGPDDDALMIEQDESFDITDMRSSVSGNEANADSPPLLRHRSHIPEDDAFADDARGAWETRIEPGFDREPAGFDNRMHLPAADMDPEEDADSEIDTDDDALGQPEFIRAAERRQQRARLLRILMIVGSVLLVLIGLAQGVYLARNRIALAAPALKPLLSAACRPLHCNIGLQRQIDQLSIESNELQAAMPGQPALTLGLLLRNHSDVALVWPDIELTLNDDDEKALIRRVFTPADYLSDPAMASLGFAADSEQNVKLTFTLAQAVASGYRVYLFYP